MNLCCPHCGAHGSIELFTSDVDARECFALQGRLPVELIGLAPRYLALFRPAQRLLAGKRARKLLAEIVGLVADGLVRRHGREWQAPPALWAHAMSYMLERREKLSLPLRDHAYLLEVICGQADKVEARIEADAEEKRRKASAAKAGGGGDAQRPIGSVISRQVAQSWIHAENETRAKFKEAQMTPAEEREYIAKLGHTVGA